MSSELEQMKALKTQLIGCVQGQMGDLKNTDAKQLGQAVDMIKDFAEAIYYCTITESMESAEKKERQTINNINYYTSPTGYNTVGKMYPDYYRDLDRENGYMYYPRMYIDAGSTGIKSNGTGMNSTTGMNGNTSYYTESMREMRRDPRQGRAAIRRRMYMEGKEMHKDTNSQLKELEAYLQELSSDITEMIRDASPEERTTLHQKMITLANKIN